LICISLIDVKTGHDEEAYIAMEKLAPDEGVTPLLVGRVFEESDILLLLHSDTLTRVDDYLIKHVRNTQAAQDLTLVPIYEFSLLPYFDSVTDLNQEPFHDESSDDYDVDEDDLLMIMLNIDVAPTMDKEVQEKIFKIHREEKIIPLMAGHTFHSKEYDVVLFFLANNLEATWEYVKKIRTIEGVWDTKIGILAHFEAMVPIEKFREYAVS
jgi:hypothetical protein